MHWKLTPIGRRRLKRLKQLKAIRACSRMGSAGKVKVKRTIKRPRWHFYFLIDGKRAWKYRAEHIRPLAHHLNNPSCHGEPQRRGPRIMRFFGFSKPSVPINPKKLSQAYSKKFLISFPLLYSLVLVESPRLMAAQAPCRECLIFMDVPKVIGGTRTPKPLTEAPSTITVITAEDIQRSGVTNIADLFRSVPGLDFMRPSVSDVNITARGLNSRLAHRMQVYIDGRSVNGEFLNLAFWHELPISLNEIERIEIVRSPSSALFGAVAFSGAIHIITRSPDALMGTLVSQTAGNAGTIITNGIHAGTMDRFGYKVSFEHDRANHFPNPLIGRSSGDKGREDFRGNILGEYKFSESALASLSAGIDSFDRDIVPGLGDDLGRFFAHGGLGFVKFNYSFGDFKFQTTWDRLQMDMRSAKLAQTVSVLADSWRLEAQHSVKFAEQHVFTGGAGHRFSTFDAPLLTGPKRKQHFFDVFLQHEYSPVDDLTFTLGARLDTHPEAGVHVSPRGSIVYSPWKDQTFRASISRGFRNPSVIENFVNFDLLAPPFGTVTVLGNKNLDSEEITSYELGYQSLLFDRLKARIDLFYNTLDKLSLGPISSPANPLELKLFTGGGGSIYGGEVGLDFLFTDWLKGQMNYSFQQRNVAWELLGIGARHKGNVGLRFTLPEGLEADVFVNIVGESTGFPAKVDPYTMVNLRLGYRFELLGTKGSLFFGASNLFNDRHREVPGGDIIERRISGGLQFKF